jgi:hypothetical protein
MSFITPSFTCGVRVLRRLLENQLNAFNCPFQIDDGRLTLCRYGASGWFGEQ